MYIIDRHHCENQNQNHHGQWFDRLSINKSVRNPPPPLSSHRPAIKVVIVPDAMLQPVRQTDTQTVSHPASQQRERGERLRYLVDVPFLTSQMLHLNASAVFLKVQTLQSQ